MLQCTLLGKKQDSKAFYSNTLSNSARYPLLRRYRTDLTNGQSREPKRSLVIDASGLNADAHAEIKLQSYLHGNLRLLSSQAPTFHLDNCSRTQGRHPRNKLTCY